MDRGGRRPVGILHRPLSAPEDTAAGVHWGHLPLVAGLALFNMLRGMGLDSVRLRWPNDLLAGKSKLAGILVERPAENMAVIGIGINVFNDVSSIAGEIKDPPARLADLVRDCPSLHAVMASLGSHLNQVLSVFSHGGVPALQEGLSRAWAGKGRFPFLRMTKPSGAFLQGLTIRAILCYPFRPAPSAPFRRT